MFYAKQPDCLSRAPPARPRGSLVRSHMTSRLAIGVLAAGCGITAASLIPEIPQAVRYAVELVTGAGPVRAVETRGGAAQRKPKGDSDVEIGEEHATIRLTDEQVAASGIELAAVRYGMLVRRIVVPGTIVPDADRIARVSVKLSATVAELRKKLGDTVEKGEVIAVLESREVANAKSEYLAARLNNDLQRNPVRAGQDSVGPPRHRGADRAEIPGRRGAGKDEFGHWPAKAVRPGRDGK
jgi:multidrug efflux pump subunit AcrA (membrane-fusion protein)